MGPLHRASPLVVSLRLTSTQTCKNCLKKEQPQKLELSTRTYMWLGLASRLEKSWNLWDTVHTQEVPALVTSQR